MLRHRVYDVCFLLGLAFDGYGGALPSEQPQTQILNPAPSPDGRKLSVSVNDGETRRLYIIDLDSGVGRRALDLNGVQYSDWHPKGRLLALDCSCSPGVSLMFILDTETGTLENIRNPSGYLFAAGPSWSPDGTRIAFAAFPRTYQGDEDWLGDIFIYDVESREHRLVSDHEAAEEFPDWLDDGTLVIDGTRTGVYRLSLLDVATGEATDVARHEDYQDAWGSVSPDGRHIAFNRSPKGSLAWQPSVVEVATGEVRSFSTGLTKAMFPRWSADGTSLFVYGGEPGAYRLYELSVTTPNAAPRPLKVELRQED